VKALSYSVLPAGSASAGKQESHYRQAKKLWLALIVLDPRPDQKALQSLAGFARSLTPIVVLQAGEGILLEVQGSLKYFSGLDAIRQRVAAELERRAWACRIATAPTPLAAFWLVRHRSQDVTDVSALPGAIGSLPLTVTAWPEQTRRLLIQMGIRSIADCLRLPRAGFARRVGRERLADLDRALGRLPDFRESCQLPETLSRSVEFTGETLDRQVFAQVLHDIVVWLEQKLRQRQMQIREVELGFWHLSREPVRTRVHFVDPVHRRERILDPLLARLERMQLAGPAVGMSLETGTLLSFEADEPGLLLPSIAGAGTARSVPEHALVECLRGRFGAHCVHGIDWVAEHRPECAWRRWLDRPGERQGVCPPPGRPLWLLPSPDRWGLTPGSDPEFEFERIESGWWDGEDVRRDYHIVVGAAGEKLWLYRDRETREWYLHGVFG